VAVQHRPVGVDDAFEGGEVLDEVGLDGVVVEPAVQGVGLQVEVDPWRRSREETLAL
jgi:hypothetical protein